MLVECRQNWALKRFIKDEEDKAKKDERKQAEERKRIGKLRQEKNMKSNWKLCLRL